MCKQITRSYKTKHYLLYEKKLFCVLFLKRIFWNCFNLILLRHFK